jgi:hypothetical protein
MASLGAFMTNPYVLAAIAAGVTAFALWKHFSHGTEKKLREAIQGEYGVLIKDMSTLKQIKQIGEQAFGKGQVSKHLLETVRLDAAKEVIQAYADQTGQKSSKLTTDKQLADPTHAGNQFIRRIVGGPIPGLTRGFDHVPVLADGGEWMLNSATTAREGHAAIAALNDGRATIVSEPVRVPKPKQTSAPGAPPAGSGARPSGGGQSGTRMEATLTALQETMDELTAHISRLSVKGKGVLVDEGLKERPRAAADALHTSLQEGHKKKEIQQGLNLR